MLLFVFGDFSELYQNDWSGENVEQKVQLKPGQLPWQCLVQWDVKLLAATLRETQGQEKEVFLSSQNSSVWPPFSLKLPVHSIGAACRSRCSVNTSHQHLPDVKPGDRLYPVISHPGWSAAPICEKGDMVWPLLFTLTQIFLSLFTWAKIIPMFASNTAPWQLALRSFQCEHLKQLITFVFQHRSSNIFFYKLHNFSFTELEFWLKTHTDHR